MKKYLICFVLALTVVSLLTAPVFAAGNNQIAGKSTPNTGHVCLYEKDPSEDWSIVEGGALGKFNFKLSDVGTKDCKVSGVFNGEGLAPGEDYSLIYYMEPSPDPWSDGWPKVEVLGEGTADVAGDVHIKADGTLGLPDNQPL